MNIEQQDAKCLTPAQLINEEIKTFLSQFGIRRPEVEEVRTVGKDHVWQYLVLLAKLFELLNVIRFEGM